MKSSKLIWFKLTLNVYDTKIFILFWLGSTVCAINRLGAENMLKTCQFKLKMGMFWAKMHIFLVNGKKL